MNNSHDEIKNLLSASRSMLSKKNDIQESNEIRKKYGLILEQESGNITKKINVAKSIEDKIDYDVYEDDEEDETPKDDKKQGYRISGGILVLHGKNQIELELTTDEKIAFQETMEEFVTEVSDLVDFDNLNLYSNNVSWSGKLIDYDIDFSFSIGEENGVYVDGRMIKVDEKFLEIITKLKTFYDKFKSKWAKILSSRKKTKKSED
jgi:hypothetical protein